MSVRGLMCSGSMARMTCSHTCGATTYSLTLKALCSSMMTPFSVYFSMKFFELFNFSPTFPDKVRMFVFVNGEQMQAKACSKTSSV